MRKKSKLSEKKTSILALFSFAAIAATTFAFTACSSGSGTDAIEIPTVPEADGDATPLSESSSDEDIPVQINSSSSYSSSPSAFSSSAKSSSSAIDKNQTLYGTFVDSRDGKTYKYVTIKTQTWMAENLNYADSIKSPILEDHTWCYNNNEEYCNLFGRLYTWIAAVDSLTSGCGYGIDCSSKIIQGICPDGWHIPTYEDFATLIKNISGQMGNQSSCSLIKSTYWWHEDNNGSDAYGFDLLPAGRGEKQYYAYTGNAKFYNVTGNASFWGSDSSNRKMYSFYCDWERPESYLISGADFKYANKTMRSVRCVKDSADYSPSTRQNEKTNSTIQKETFVDERDGHKYKLVTIGSQKWMAEDLRFTPEYHTSMEIHDYVNCLGGCIIPDTVLTYNWSCNKNGTDTSYCTYSFAAAMDSVNTSCGSGSLCKKGTSKKGFCPEGWRIPSAEDYEKLISFAGGENIAGFFLRSNKGDEYGADLYGFSAISTNFITSDEIDKDSLFAFVMDSDTARVVRTTKSLGYDYSTGWSGKGSIRCIEETK